MLTADRPDEQAGQLVDGLQDGDGLADVAGGTRPERGQHVRGTPLVVDGDPAHQPTSIPVSSTGIRTGAPLATVVSSSISMTVTSYETEVR